MTKIVWFELYIPVEVDLTAVTAVIRTLASRPASGQQHHIPAVVFELRAESGIIHWLLGIDNRLCSYLPGQLRAQLPGLVITKHQEPKRSMSLVTSNVRPIRSSQVLRLEMAPSVTARLLVIMQALNADESAVVQWGIGPTHQPKIRTTSFQLTQTGEPLFAVRGQIGATSRVPERASAVVSMLFEALAQVNATHTEVRATKPKLRLSPQVADVLTTRTRWSGLLSAPELAAVLGWPVAGVTSLLSIPLTFESRPPKEKA